MLKNYKKLIALILPLFAVISIHSCKKQDKYPSQILPTINGVFPNTAFAGTPVTIKGTNLKNVEMVRFDTMALKSFNTSLQTDTSLTVIVPDSLPVGKIFIQVYYKDGTGYTAYNFTVLPTPKIPKIDSLSPLTALPEEIITLFGKNFDVVKDVRFGTATATFTATANKIRATIPANAEGGVQSLIVTAPDGADTIPFTVAQTPVITSISPTFGKVGDVVTVKGKRFKNITSVKLGSVATTYKVVDENTITFVVPAGALSGNITVVNSEGTAVSATSFTVDNPSFKLVVFDDALNADWEKWGGWGTSVQEMANTEHPKSGSNAIKITWTDAYGGFQLHPKNIFPLPGPDNYSSIKISLYGGDNATAASKIALYVKNSAGVESTKKELTLVPGAYTTYVVSLNDLGNPSDITELNLQNYGTANITIYVDDYGLN